MNISLSRAFKASGAPGCNSVHCNSTRSRMSLFLQVASSLCTNFARVSHSFSARRNRQQWSGVRGSYCSSQPLVIGYCLVFNRNKLSNCVRHNNNNLIVLFVSCIYHCCGYEKTHEVVPRVQSKYFFKIYRQF